MISTRIVFLLFLINAAVALNVVADLKFDWTKIEKTHGQVHEDEHHKPALKEANAQLACMLLAVHWATTRSDPHDKGQVQHKKYLRMIKDVFGEEAEVAIIKTWTEELAKTTLVIASDSVPNPPEHEGWFALTDPTNHEVYIYARYHDSSYLGIEITSVQRARIILHEASHAFKHSTWDWWTAKDGHTSHVSKATYNLHEAATKKRDKHESLTAEETSHILESLLNGYWHAGYIVLKEEASHIMHQNADSWAVFGYYCQHGKFPFPRDINAGEADPKSVVWTA